jgi:hypothetical protein
MTLLFINKTEKSINTKLDNDTNQNNVLYKYTSFKGDITCINYYSNEKILLICTNKD